MSLALMGGFLFGIIPVQSAQAQSLSALSVTFGGALQTLNHANGSANGFDSNVRDYHVNAPRGAGGSPTSTYTIEATAAGSGTLTAATPISNPATDGTLANPIDGAATFTWAPVSGTTTRDAIGWREHTVTVTEGGATAVYRIRIEVPIAGPVNIFQLVGSNQGPTVPYTSTGNIVLTPSFTHNVFNYTGSTSNIRVAFEFDIGGAGNTRRWSLNDGAFEDYTRFANSAYEFTADMTGGIRNIVRIQRGHGTQLANIRTYTIGINRGAPPSNSNLDALTVMDDSTDLFTNPDPDLTFAATTNNYNLGELANDVTELDITAGVAQAMASIAATTSTAAISPIGAITDDAEFNVDISRAPTGSTNQHTITLTVTAANGSTTDYNITFTRASAGPALSSDSTLSDLTITATGGTAPSITFPGTGTFNLGALTNAITALNITATRNDGAATGIAGTGSNGITVPATITSASAAIFNISGATAGSGNTHIITLTVTAEDGSSTPYMITFTRALPTVEMTLSHNGDPAAIYPIGSSALEVAEGDTVTLIFTRVGDTTGTLDVVWDYNGGSTPALNADRTPDAGVKTLTIPAGESMMTTDVGIVAEDPRTGEATEQFRVVLATDTAYTTTGTVDQQIRILGQQSALTSLTVGGTALGTTEGFTADDHATEIHTLSLGVANSVSSVTVTPTATIGTAAGITVDSATVASGDTSGAIALVAGTGTLIPIIVTAEDGQTISTYNLTVTREAAAGTTAPDAPTAPDVAGSSEMVQGQTNHVPTLTATWTADSAITATSYRVRWRTSPSGAWQNAAGDDSTEMGVDVGNVTSYEINPTTALALGTAYEVALAVTTADGTSDFSGGTARETWNVPGSPDIFRVASAANSLLIDIDVASARGAPITGYLLLHKLAGTADSTFIEVPVTNAQVPDPAFPITGLINGQEYVVDFVALSVLGRSAQSGNQNATPQGPPNMVTDLAATAGPLSATLNWTAIANTAPANGGSTITSYRYRWSIDGGSSWTSAGGANGVAIVGSGATTATAEITGLTAVAHTFEVSAINARTTNTNRTWSNMAMATPTAATTQSSDATLSNLTIVDANSNDLLAAASLTFASGTTEYNLGTLANDVTSITVTPTATDFNIQSLLVSGTTGITVTGAQESGTALTADISNALADGAEEHQINIFTTAEDGNTGGQYTIIFFRAAPAVVQSNIATLTSIGVADQDGTAITTAITGFTADTGSGTLTLSLGVDNNVSSVTITPTATNADISALTVDSTAVASGDTSTAIALVAGTGKLIPIIVTAQDGTTIVTYNLTVTRAQSASAALTIPNIGWAQGNATFMRIVWTPPSAAADLDTTNPYEYRYRTIEATGTPGPFSPWGGTGASVAATSQATGNGTPLLAAEVIDEGSTAFCVGEKPDAAGDQHIPNNANCRLTPRVASDIPVGLSGARFSQGAVHVLELRAVHSNGTRGAWASVTTGTPANQSPLTAPTAPAIAPTLAAASDTSITVNWTYNTTTTPSASTGNDRDNYRVRWAEAGTGDWQGWTAYDGTTFTLGRADNGVSVGHSYSNTTAAADTGSYAITGLTQGTLYDVQYAVQNGPAISGWSDTATAVTNTGGNPTLPAITMSASSTTPNEGDPVTITFTRTLVTSDPVTVNYTVGGDATPGTGNDYDTLGSTVVIPADMATATLNINTLTDDAADDGETIVITIGSGDYTISGTNPITITIADVVPAAADAPANVVRSRTANTPQSITLTWDMVTNATDYRYRWSSDGDDSDWENTGGATGVLTGNVTTIAIGSLPRRDSSNQNISYVFQVAAVVSGSTGTWSPSTSSLIPFSQASAPVTAMNTIRGGLVDVAWTAPTDNGGDPVTAYNVGYRLGTSSGSFTNHPFDTDDSETATSLTRRIEGLNVSVDYQVQITATTGAGESLALVETFTTTPGVLTITTMETTIAEGDDPDTTNAVNLQVTATPTPVTEFNIVIDVPNATGGSSVTWLGGNFTPLYTAGTSMIQFPVGIRGNTLVNTDNTMVATISVTTPTTGEAYMVGTEESRSVSVTDNERPNAAIAFHASDATSSTSLARAVAESAGTIMVPVTVSALPSVDSDFTIEVDSGDTADFTLNTTSLTFSASDGGLTQQVSITITDDALQEDAEEIVLRIAAGTGSASGTAAVTDASVFYTRNATATITINASDTATEPTVAPEIASVAGSTAGSAAGLLFTTSAAPENVGSGLATATKFALRVRTPPSTGTYGAVFDATPSVSGTAAAEATSFLVISDGTTALVANTIYEVEVASANTATRASPQSDTFIARTPSAACVSNTAATCPMTQPTLTIAATTTGATIAITDPSYLGAGSVGAQFGAAPALAANPYALTYTVNGGAAVTHTDSPYAPSDTIPALTGLSGGDDLIFTLATTNTQTTYSTSQTAPATVITAGANLSALVVAPTGGSITTNGAADCTTGNTCLVELDNAVTSFTVMPTIGMGTSMTLGAVGSVGGTLIASATHTSGNATASINIGLGETVTVTMVVSAAGGVANTFTLTVTRAKGTVTLTPPSMVTEDTAFSVGIEFSPALTASARGQVAFSRAGTGNAASEDADISFSGGATNFISGVGVSSIPTAPSLFSDNLVEFDETVAVSFVLETAPAMRYEQPAAVNITVQDNDRANATITFGAPSAANLVEHDTTDVTVVATLSPPAETATTFAIATSGTATDDTDYTATDTLTFNANVTTATVTLDQTDDFRIDPSETIILTLPATTDTATNLSTFYEPAGTASVTITDDDVKPTMPQNLTPDAVPGETTQLDVTWTAPVTLGGTGVALTGYRIRWRADSATSFNPVDGVVTSSATSHRITGLTAGTDYVVEVAADTNVLDASGSPFTGNDRVWATQTGSAAGTIALSSAAISAAEGDSAMITANISPATPAGAAGFTLTLTPSVESNNNAATSDFTTTALTRTPAETDATSMFAIPLTPNNLVDNDKTFTVTLTGTSLPTDYAITTSTATVTIEDDEADAARVSFGNDAETAGTVTATVPEGMTTFNVPVTINQIPSRDVTFAVTAGGSAVAADYTIATSSVTFLATESILTKNVAVTILEDTVRDANETISLTLAAAATGINSVTHTDLGDFYTRTSGGNVYTITITDTTGVPGAPIDLALAPANQSLVATWKVPTDLGSPAVISNYLLRWAEAGTTNYANANLGAGQDVGDVLTFTIPGLTNGTAYDVQVAASNGVATTVTDVRAWHAVVTATPSNAADGTLSDLVVMSVTPVAGGGTPTKATLTLNPSFTAGEINYAVTLPNTATGITITATTNSNTATATLDGTTITSGTETAALPVAEGAEKDFVIVVTSEDGTDIDTYTVTVTRGAGTPEQVTGVNVVVEGAGVGSLDVNWTALTGADIAAPTLAGYRVRWRTAATDGPDGVSGGGDDVVAGEWQDEDGDSEDGELVAGSGTTYKITGLTTEPATLYDVQVAADNGTAVGAWSATASATPVAADVPATIPDIPLSNAIPARNSITLTWTAPANGGDDIISYEIQWQEVTTPIDEIDDNLWTTGSLDETAIGEFERGEQITFTIPNLEIDTAYYIRVRAANGIAGPGEWSGVRERRTLPMVTEQQSTMSSKANIAVVARAITSSSLDVLGARLTDFVGTTPGIAADSQGDYLSIGGALARQPLASQSLARQPQAVREHNIDIYNPGSSLAPIGWDDENAASFREVDWRDLLRDTAFSLKINHGDDEHGSGGDLGVWGMVDFRRFEGNGGEDLASVEGEAISGYVGADYAVGRWLAGVAVSYTDTTTDYTLEGDPLQGESTGWMASFFPYVRLNALADLDVWTLMGFGWGELEQQAAGTTLTTDTHMQLYAFGMKWDFPTIYGVEIAAKADAAISRLEVFGIEGPNGLDPSQQSQQRWRLAFETGRAFNFGGSSVRPTLELGLRLDRGDLEAGQGLEIAGAVSYNYQPLRLSVNARGRGLLVHTVDGLEEWGVSVLARVEPGALGSGFSLSLEPGWGASPNGNDELWRDESLFRDTNRQNTTLGIVPERFQAELGYGLRIAHGNALVTPIARYGIASSRQTLGLGTRLAVGSATSFELLGERVGDMQTFAADEDYRVRLTSRLRF